MCLFSDTFSQRSDCKMKPATDRCCFCGKLTDYSAMKRTSLRSTDLIASIHKKLVSCCRKKDFSKVLSISFHLVFNYHDSHIFIGMDQCTFCRLSYYHYLLLYVLDG